MGIKERFWSKRPFLVVALGLLTFLGLALRAWGIQWCLSIGESRPDELVIISKALGYGAGDFNPHFFNYPSLLSYVLFAFYGVYAMGLMAMGAIQSVSDVLIRLAEDPAPFILISRSFSVMMGAVAVPALYWAVRPLFGKASGLLAALFFAVAYLPVRDAHFGVTDTPMVTMVVFALIPILRILRGLEASVIFRVASDSLRLDYLMAGVLAGLASGFKYNAALLALPILWAHLASPVMRHHSLPRRLISRNLWLAAACMVGVFLTTSPYILLDWGTFISDFMFEVRHLTGVGEALVGRGWETHLRISLWYGVGPALLLMALVGIGVGFRYQWRTTLCLLVFPFFYYLLIGKGFTVFVRYILPVVPFLCVFAAVAVVNGLYPWVRRRWGEVAGVCAVSLVAGLIVLPNLARAVSFDRLICQQDTREQAIVYVRDALPPGVTLGWVGTRYGYPRFPETTNSLERQLQKARAVGQAGRFLKARHEAALRRGKGVDVVWLTKTEVSEASSLPSYILLEEYPLPYSQNSTDGARAIVLGRGFQLVTEFKSAEWLLLTSPGIVFDKQDSLYAPYAGCGFVTRPGPNLSLWMLSDTSK